MSPNPKLPPVKVDIPHKYKILSFKCEFIEKVIDVAGDCHCALCAVAGLHDISVDDYQIIRYQLLKDLTCDDSESYF